MSARAICSRCGREINLNKDETYRVVVSGHTTTVEHLVCPEDLKKESK